MKNILLIGTGHMGSAVLKALSQNFKEEKNIFILNRTFEKSKELAKVYNAIAIENLSEIENLNIDIFIIGIRPDDCQQLFNDLKAYNINNKLIISMVNALTVSQIKNALSQDINVIRIIPNMNAINFASTTCLYQEGTNLELLEFGNKIVASFGSIHKILEEQFASFSAMNGCSPAYIFSFINGFLKFAIDQGYEANKAKEFISQTIIATSENVLTNSTDLRELINQICVPNGSTIQGQNILDENKFEEIIYSALLAATKAG